MVAQFPEDLVHLEGGEDRLDQHRRADRPFGQPEPCLRVQEDVVPQPRFEMALELRQVEVGAGAARHQFFRIVKEEQREVEERAGHRLAVDEDVLFRQMPAARPHEQHRGLAVQRIMPPRLRVIEGDRPAHRITEIGLAFDQVVPGRRIGVLEIGHEDIGAAIQRIDHHLAVGRAGDLDAAVLKVARDRRHPPVAVADRLGLRQEIGLPSGIEPALDLGAAGEKTPPLRTEFTLELDGKVDRLGCEHLLIAGLHRPANGDARGHCAAQSCTAQSWLCTKPSSWPCCGGSAG